MALGVGQLVDFIEAYLGHYGTREAGSLSATYDADSHQIVLALGGLTRRLPVIKMNPMGAMQIADYVEEELVELKSDLAVSIELAEFRKQASEVEPDGRED